MNKNPNQPLHLGQQSALPTSPDAAVLDYVANPRAGSLYMIRFAAPEFTSLCPVTGQPDFAHLVIDYAPGETIVESKSLKLFLGAFRNHAGALAELIEPRTAVLRLGVQPRQFGPGLTQRRVGVVGLQPLKLGPHHLWQGIERVRQQVCILPSGLHLDHF